MPVAILLAIGVIVPLRMGGEVHQGEAVMGGEEIDGAAAVAGEDVARSGDPRGEGARHARVAAPEAPHVVAIAVIPFQPLGGEAAKLVAARADVPGFGDHHSVGEHGIGAHRLQQRRVGIEAMVHPPQRRAEIETEAVDAGLLHEMAQRRQDDLPHRRRVAGDAVAGAGVVDQPPVGGVAERAPRVQTAQRQGRSLTVAFAVMIIDHVEQDADARFMERRHRLPQFGHAAGSQARIDRKPADRIIAPIVGEAERPQMPLVDPGVDRHQLDGGDMERLEMGDHRRMTERRDRPALRRRDIGMAHGEAAHMEFVDQPPAREERRPVRDGRQTRLHHALGHQRRGVAALPPRRGKRGIIDEGPIDRGRIGIEQQLVGVEPQAGGGIIGSIGAQAIARARADAPRRDLPDPIGAALHRQAGFAILRVEQA